MKYNFKYVLFAALLTVACQPKPDPSSQNDLDQLSETPKEMELDQGSKNAFAEAAAIGSMMEVESSAHMIKLTENPDVQNLATIMVRDHTMAQKELSKIAKEEKIAQPQSLPTAKKNELAKLDSLQEEQRNYDYAQLMVNEHEKAVKLFESASQTESNPKLKQFAAAKLPVLKHHLAETYRLFKLMRDIRGDKGDYPLKTKAQSKP